MRLIVGKKIADVLHDWPKSFPNAPADVRQFLIGAQITDVRRRAKVLLIDLDSGYSLVIHLKMTGQMVYVGEQRFGAGHPNDSLVDQLPDRSTRVTLAFSDDTKLFFNDQRKFGWVKLIPTDLLRDALAGSVLESNARKQRSAQQTVQTVPSASTGAGDAAVDQELLQTGGLGLTAGKSATDAALDFFKKVGPEPLSADFTWQVLYDRMQRRKNSNIKAVLLDQTILAGIGNIYADEGLWGARIHPETLVRDISKQQVKRLHAELQFVLSLAIEKGGSSNHTYINAEGKKGSYMDFARVFRREKLPCPHCGTTIIKTRVAGRGTHTCPRCQQYPYQKDTNA